MNIQAGQKIKIFYQAVPEIPGKIIDVEVQHVAEDLIRVVLPNQAYATYAPARLAGLIR